MSPINSLGNSGLGTAGLTSGGLTGSGLAGGGGGGPFELPGLRDYRGRVSAAIPTSGIILPEARNVPTDPVTHSISNLPAGLTFAAATRAVTGTPTASYTAREIGVWGEAGKVEGREGVGTYRLSGRRDERDENRSVEMAEGGHGGGDVRLLADALSVFRGERDPVAGLDAAYWAAVLGIVAEESVARGGERLTLAELGATP